MYQVDLLSSIEEYWELIGGESNFKFDSTAEYLLRELKTLEAYIYHKAYPSNSIYIKFKDRRLGSIRISDHEGRSRYSYRWNLRSDIESKNDKLNHRYYYNIKEINNMINHIINYERAIKGNEN